LSAPPAVPRRVRRNPDDITPGRLTRNMLTFGRELRDAGLPIGSGQLISFVDAISEIDVRIRQDFYSAAKVTLVTSPEQIPVFDAIFGQFWRRIMNPVGPVETSFEDLLTDEEPPDDSTPRDASDAEKKAGQDNATRVRERSVLSVEDTGEEGDGEAEDLDDVPDDVIVFSAREVLRKKDFSQFTQEEVAEARRMIARMDWRLGTRLTRRKQRANNGEFVDYRATLRRSLRNSGVPIELKRRRRKERMRPLVLICDISGSMDRYSRLLLQFVHALEHGLDAVEVFVFSTRLTRITRELRKRNVDSAIENVVNSVDDWSGGTRIGEAIKDFNFNWGRRVLRSGATVIMISDGWDRGDPKLLSKEMARLQRSCRRLIWLNPLLGAPGYQPLTQGIRAALPYVDLFLPIHNLKSMEVLAHVLADFDDQPPVRRQSSLTGTAAEQLPGIARIGNRGELTIEIDPKYVARVNSRR
jgi:uncharacterized protein with von Willebrand factor type A (vWA) domain